MESVRLRLSVVWQDLTDSGQTNPATIISLTQMFAKCWEARELYFSLHIEAHIVYG